MRFGVELVGLVDRGDGVHATLRDRATGAQERVAARFVVGADGPRGDVRRALGIGLTHLGTLGEFVNVMFRADLEPVIGERRYGLYIDRAPGGGRRAGARRGRPLVLRAAVVPRARRVGRRPHAVAVRRADPRGRRGAGPRGAGAGAAAVHDGRRARGRVPRGQRLPRRRRGAPDDAGGRRRHEHRDRRGAQPRLEAGLGRARVGGPRAAGQLRAERRPVGEYRARRSLRMGGPPEPDPLGEDLGVRYASSVVAADAGSGRRTPG